MKSAFCCSRPWSSWGLPSVAPDPDHHEVCLLLLQSLIIMRFAFCCSIPWSSWGLPSVAPDPDHQEVCLLLLQTLIIMKFIKSALEKSTFTVRYLFFCLSIIQKSRRTYPGFLQFLKVHYSPFFCNLPELLHLCTDGRLRSMSDLVHRAPDKNASRNLVERMRSTAASSA